MALRAGAIRFNTDTSQMEIWDGNQWTGILATSSELETGGDIGILGSVGIDGQYVNKVDKVNMSSTGDAIDFADLNYTTAQNGVHGSRTHAVFNGGYNPSGRQANTDYVTIASGGTATAGGSLTTARQLNGCSASNSTRGLQIGGYVGPSVDPSFVNTIDYITFSEKSAAVDFGDMTNGNERCGSCASPTRAISTGGAQGPNAHKQEIRYVTISTLGNTADFGTLQETRTFHGAGSNAVRGIICGDAYPGTNVVTYITIATLGNDIDFGDLTNDRNGLGAAASKTRIIAFGGRLSPNPAGNTDIDYAQIMTTGNFFDFGDLSANACFMDGTSNSHGGL
tara:strand:+ start:2070 stop:3083 length:1014 start_codon:yes stop_codon:yes gene_type:complete